jgi:hypothetical protein
MGYFEKVFNNLYNGNKIKVNIEITLDNSDRGSSPPEIHSFTPQWFYWRHLKEILNFIEHL